MNIFNKLKLSMVSWEEKLWFWYLKNTIMEEVLFRYIILTICGVSWAGAILSIYGYALIHLIQFKIQMATVTMLLGLLLYYIFFTVVAPYNLILCILVHYIAGTILNLLGYTTKWKK